MGLLQGEMVNRIEHNINQSSNYVEKAKENTQQAVTYQKKARKVQQIYSFVSVSFSKWSLHHRSFKINPVESLQGVFDVT